MDERPLSPVKSVAIGSTRQDRLSGFNGSNAATLRMKRWTDQIGEGDLPRIRREDESCLSPEHRSNAHSLTVPQKNAVELGVKAAFRRGGGVSVIIDLFIMLKLPCLRLLSTMNYR